MKLKEYASVYYYLIAGKAENLGLHIENTQVYCHLEGFGVIQLALNEEP
jgi:hypothetical protein